MKRHAAPIIAAILLLLPVLYVGSYFALLRGAGSLSMTSSGACERKSEYRIAGDACRTVFWPLERMDRKMRPEAWKRRTPLTTLDLSCP